MKVKSLRKNIGTCKESYSIIDFKDKPTILTKIAVLVNSILTTMNVHKALVPILKLFTFILDITKDFGFLFYTTKILFGEQSDRFSSEGDMQVYAFYLHTWP